jgi:flagellin
MDGKAEAEKISGPCHWTHTIMEETMSLRINTNIAALTAYQNLQKNQGMQADAIEKLSSGLRINKAADDAAGLSISQGLTSQINGLTQAVSNAQDGINVAQIADGALGTTQQVLQRMRTLALKASNAGTNDPGSLTAINSELKSLSTELDNISTQTKFGQQNLLDGKYGGSFQVGANAGESISLNLTTATLAPTGSAGIPSWSVNAASGAPASGVIASGSVGSVNLASGFNAGSLGVDFNNGDNAAVATFASGASGANTVSFSGTANAGVALDVTVQYTGGTVAMTGTANYNGAEIALASIDNAIAAVSSARSQVGATQNQFKYTVSNLQTSITNVTASRSNITDADLATEVSAMTQAQILTQAATSVLAQANSAPQSVLKLLQ